MPPQRSPRRAHPRSLDALFGRPKKKAVKRCLGGHRQAHDWTPSDECSTCKREWAAIERVAKALEDPDRGKAEREAWRQRLGPPPVILTMVETSTGRVISFRPGPARGRRRA